MKGNLKSITSWIEDRTGIFGLWQRITSGAAEKHGAWLRTTGVACLVLVLVECITGPILGLYYTPSPNAAYKSILAIEQNPMGKFLRGIHHWSSATLIILALLTIIRMFFTADYKAGKGRNRDVVWIAALLFFQFVLLLQLTGHILPWDTNAVKTADVEAGIGGNVWVFGPIIKRFLLGGGSTGSVTLTRWYGFHVFVLPLIMILAVGLPLLAHRLRGGAKKGAVEDEEVEVVSDSEPASPTEPYYPFQLAREMMVALVIFLVVAGMAFMLKTPLEKEATAANLEGYTALSEWYVLPMHALTLIPPFNTVAFEPVATIVLPGILFTVLILLPFIDRNPSRAPSKRPIAMVAGGLTIVSTLGLYMFSVITEKHPDTEKPAETAVKPGGGGNTINLTLVEQGKKVYKEQGCEGCHAIAGKGGAAAPDLTHAGKTQPDRKWQVEHLIKPTAKVPGSTMPPYAQLKKEQLDALAEYMISLK